MKLKFFIAAAAVSVLAACSETMIEAPFMRGEMVNVELSIATADTKVVDDSKESTLVDYQILVFDAEGQLETYKYMANAAQPVTFGAFKGTKQVYALVNAPSLADVKSYDDFCSRRSKLKDNLTTKMVMQGFQSVEIGTEDLTLKIPVERMVSKVSLVKVVNNLAAYCSDLKFTLRDAYLINVAGDMPYGHAEDADMTPEEWFNKRAFVSGDNLSAMTCGSFNHVVANGGESPFVHNFYCYPNPTVDDSSEEEWCARHTRLVVEVELGETLYYYPVTMPVLERNTQYEVTLTVTGPGTDDPDNPYNKDAANVSIELLDWYDGGEIKETI